ncbi:hypothetical protein FPRO06_07817 [Fusarium proliferatum]|nr:hypothetical protein FPRO06_07817 [Fusarium proliferatum]CVL11961.1 related to tol protein [Fusarium proliferatum]
MFKKEMIPGCNQSQNGHNAAESERGMNSASIIPDPRSSPETRASKPSSDDTPPDSFRRDLPRHVPTGISFASNPLRPPWLSWLPEQGDDRPEPQLGLDSNGLCPGCAELITMSVRNPTLTSEVPPNPRIRYRLQEECKLCPLLFYAYRQRPSQAANITPQGYVEMVTFSLVKQTPRTLNIIQGPRSHYSDSAGPPGAGDTICVAVKALLRKNVFERPWDEKEILLDLGAFIALCVDEDIQTSPSGAQPIVIRDTSDRFEPSLVLEWLERCRQEHTPSCSLSSQGFPETLTLVDCVESQACRHRHINHSCGSKCPGKRLGTVDVAPFQLDRSSFEYIALSYVWGTTKPSKGQVEDGLNPPPPSSIALGPCLDQVANTIFDAIQVTMALGRRYLWVDQYCIDQENPVKKRAQIKQMRRIYSNADLTIVAAAGKDANYGLPGVGERPKRHPPTLKVGSVTARVVPLLPSKSIPSSTWASRGWTFEEAFLSRRRLVFLEDQLYFECNLGHACERIVTSPETYLNNNPSMSLLTIYGSNAEARNKALLQGIQQESPQSHAYQANPPSRESDDIEAYIQHGVLPCLQAVVEYSKRTLTDPSDSLHAFVGMLEHFQDAIATPLCHIWGVPLPAILDARHTDLVRFLAVGLAWYHGGDGKPRGHWDWVHNPPCHRRTDFPSWSWVGWEGMKKFPSSFEGLLSDVTCDVMFRDGDRGASNISLDDIVQLNKDQGPAADHPRILVMSAQVIPNRVFTKFCHLDALNATLDGADPKTSDDTWEGRLRKGGDYVCVWLGRLGSVGYCLVLARKGKGWWRRHKVLYQRLGIVSILLDGKDVECLELPGWDRKLFEIE